MSGSSFLRLIAPDVAAVDVDPDAGFVGRGGDLVDVLISRAAHCDLAGGEDLLVE